MDNDRNKVAVELTASLFDPNTPTEEREKKLAEMSIATYLTVQDHDKLFDKMDTRMEDQDQVIATLPCKSGGCPDNQDTPAEALSLGPFHISFSGKQNMGSAWTLILILVVIFSLAALIYFAVKLGIKP
jgi:hypothetical protein